MALHVLSSAFLHAKIEIAIFCFQYIALKSNVYTVFSRCGASHPMIDPYQ